MTTGIYLIYAPDGGSYIGSAIDIERRWVDHRRDLKNGTHHSHKLQAAWDRHKGKLSFEIMCECAESELLALEQKKIDEYMPEFNMCLVAARSSVFNAAERSRLVSEAESLLRSNSRDAREIMKAREREYGFKSALEIAQKNIRHEDALAREARVLAQTTDSVVISTRETRLASSVKLRELYDAECERNAYEKRQREYQQADRRIAAELAERERQMRLLDEKAILETKAQRRGEIWEKHRNRGFFAVMAAPAFLIPLLPEEPKPPEKPVRVERMIGEDSVAFAQREMDAQPCWWWEEGLKKLRWKQANLRAELHKEIAKCKLREGK